MNCKVILSIVFSCLALSSASPISDSKESFEIEDVEKVASPLTVVGTCPPRDTNVTIFLPDSEDCTIYYICSNGRPIKVQCTPGMSWNTEIQTCDWDINVDCPNRTEKESFKIEAVVEDIVRPLTAVGTCPPRDTNVTVFLPDSENCTIYYICSNGRPIKVECTPGMSWNTEIQTCDWDINVECPNNQQEDKTKKVVRTAQGTCPEVDSLTPVFFPDSDSCDVYYECSNGAAVRNVCPLGLYFNTRGNVCDWPSQVDCQASSPQPTETMHPEP